MGLFSFLSFLSCSGPKTNEQKQEVKDIRSFEYHYNGSIGANSYQNTVTCTDEGITLSIEEMPFPEYGTLSCKVDSAFLHALEALCTESGVAGWNGFNRSNPDVCDGDGFSLYITYEDGKTISAHGSNSFPSGYRDFRDGLRELVAPYREQMQDKAKQEIIKKGIQGKLQSMLVVFIQHGKSGFDQYHVLITHEGIRKKNFEVRIKSVSGEIFPKGELNLYKEVPDKMLSWDKFEKLFRKHNIINWYNYDKAAEDYNNAEWFQLGIGFEDNHISAMGTEHPEGYDVFRKDFLTLLKKTIDSLPAE